MWPAIIAAIQAARGQQQGNNADKPNGGVEFERNNYVSTDPNYDPYKSNQPPSEPEKKEPPKQGGGGGWGSLISSIMGSAKNQQSQNNGRQLGQGVKFSNSSWYGG